MDPEKVTYFAETDMRNTRKRFGIKSKDRQKHMYVIGKTGMGKSTLLSNMIVQDIQNGNGVAVIDPHGALADEILDYVPEDRIDDVVYFAPFDLENPIAFNVMEDVGYDKRHLVVNGLMSAFRKIWADQWSSRMEYILTNTILALLEYPGATMLGVNRMYTDKNFRKRVVENIQDPLVKAFWVEEFATYTDRYTQEATPAIQNKIGQFTGNPLIRNIIGQAESSFDLRKIIDERKIFICNLSKGLVGEVNANLLGSMLITKLYLAAMGRADVSLSELKALPDFYLYVDEFQSFANESFADILSEARKYKLNLTMAHQYIEQMSEEVRAAVFGNVGTMIVFRVGAYDADVLEKEFAPRFTAQDLVNLGFTQIYLKLMIDGVTSQPFSATTLPPIPIPEVSYKDHVIAASQKTYGAPREEVERHVSTWHLGEEVKEKDNTANETAQKKSRPQKNNKNSPKPTPDIESSNHKEQLVEIAQELNAKHAPTKKPRKRKKETKLLTEEERAQSKEELKSALASVLAKESEKAPKQKEQEENHAKERSTNKKEGQKVPQKKEFENSAKIDSSDTMSKHTSSSNGEVSEDELKDVLG